MRVGRATLHLGDCLDILATLEPESVDSCVCDPPYHLTSIVKRFGTENAAPARSGKTGAYARASRGFMGQQWDGGDVAFRPETWDAVYRVLKPGAHLIAFSGTRTYHRMVCAIEDAGFEIRDQLAWVYGSGFPKSHNQPGGWGTALKPAWEPICLARKPLQGTVAANVLEFGTGAINIDGCRISTNGEQPRGSGNPCPKGNADILSRALGNGGNSTPDLGRWPANIIHDGSEEVLAHFPDAPGQLANASLATDEWKTQNVYGAMRRGRGDEPSASRRYADAGGTDFAMLPGQRRGDSGSAARFFYCAKTSAAERHAGCCDLDKGNTHPTVKPVDLMRYLTRLVTPKGGLVLDPFAGSGSTLVAASWEGFRSIGCELSPDYLDIARRRLTAAQAEIDDASRQASMFDGEV